MELIALKPDDLKLRLPCVEITRTQLKTLKMQETIEQLLDFVYGHNNKGDERERTRPMTVGLSAPQVGLNLRISVVDLAIGSKRYNDIHVLVNPTIVKHSQVTASHREGCVNLPRIWGPVTRYRSVTVKALDRSGNRLTFQLSGWPAVLLQHEIDHLEGRLFIDHLKDPTRAHLLEAEHFKEYNKKAAESWPYTVDVSDLVKLSR